MLVWLILVLFSGGFSYLYYSLSNNICLLALWIILGIITSIVLIFLGTFIFLFFGQFTSGTNKFKRFYIYQFARFALNVMRIHLHVEGKENLPDKNQTMIVCGNHKSLLDVVLVYSAIDRPMGFVSKKDNYKIWILKICLNCLSCISMDRENDREAAKDMIRAIKKVRSGLSMCIFPEGGIKDRAVNEMLDTKPGAFKLATKTDSWIIPMAIVNNHLLQYNAFKRRTDIYLQFLPAIKKEDYESMSTVEIGEKLQSDVNRTIKELSDKNKK